MISNNNTNLNLSYYPPSLCLLLLPRSLMLLPPPHSLPPLPIHMHSSTFNCHTQTHISSDSTGRPGQTRRFLAVIWIETVLVHCLEWPAENSREMVPWNWKNVVQMIWNIGWQSHIIHISCQSSPTRHPLNLCKMTQQVHCTYWLSVSHCTHQLSVFSNKPPTESL